MKRVALLFTVLLLSKASMGICLNSLCIASKAEANISKPVERDIVEEWEIAPVGEVDVPDINNEQLLAEVEQAINEKTTFGTWKEK